jgi:hypothetical protein
MENLRKVLLGIIIGMSICMIAAIMCSCSVSVCHVVKYHYNGYK